MNVKTVHETNMMAKLSRNQLVHTAALETPMIFITSRSRRSFSRTIDLIIIDEAYTHESTINKGNVREIRRMNLEPATNYYCTVTSSFKMRRSMLFLLVEYVARIWHLLQEYMLLREVFACYELNDSPFNHFLQIHKPI